MALHLADGNGGTGSFARWRVILQGSNLIRLQNIKTGRYLRIQRNNEVNVGGGLGALTLFRYQVHLNPNGV